MIITGEVLQDPRTGSKATVVRNCGIHRRQRDRQLCERVEVHIFVAKSYHKEGDHLIWMIPLEEET